MAIKYGWNLALLFVISLIFRMAEGLMVLDDTDSPSVSSIIHPDDESLCMKGFNFSPRLIYSNAGPSWWAANWHNGAGRLVGGNSNLTRVTPYKFTWHETQGDGASVSLTFTGTRVNLNVTICGTIYDTVVDFFIDGENKGRYEHYSAGPVTLHDTARCDPQFLVTIADFDGLSPAQHTFKAVSVGNVLFAVDSISYEASTAVSISSSPVVSSPAGTTVSGSTTTTTTTTSSSSTTTSRSTSTSASSSTSSAGDSQPVVSSMDVSAADSRISYAPPGAWKQYTNTRRTTSCLDGTMSSSTVNSSLTYNFAGPAIQVYTISGPNGGNFTISMDSQNQGTYSSYDASADPSTCPSIPLYSTMSLADTQHTLVLTVQDHPSSSIQDTVQFVGFRTPSSTTVSSPSSGASPGPNLAPIIGGVVGGLVGLILLAFLVIWGMRRRRRMGEADLLSKMPDPLPSSFSFVSNAQRQLLTDDQVHEAAESLGSSFTPSMAQRDRSNISHDAPPIAPLPPHHYATDTETDDDDDMRERLTYYTLPSYHENVMQNAAARNLSEADVNAISRRLQEVMRSQMVQAGRDPNELVGVMPPRELINHLVEEQLQPRAV